MDATDADLTRYLSSYNYRNRVSAKRDIMTAVQHYRTLRVKNGKTMTHIHTAFHAINDA